MICTPLLSFPPLAASRVLIAQIKQADKIASGQIPAWNVDPEASVNSSADEEDDGYEDVLVSISTFIIALPRSTFLAHE